VRPESDPYRAVDVTRWRDSDPLHRIVDAAAGEEGVPRHILAGLVEDESSWRPKVVGKHGEVGLLQLKKAVATWCGIKDRLNAAQNASCGARYLAAQFARFGSWEMALVAFKAGPGSIPDAIPATSWAYAQRALQKAEAYR
jgi:soluble lytic murein transglycosylase-like protein